MLEEVTKRFEKADIVIKTAAVADYRPKTVLSHKMKKQQQDWSVEMERNVDILKYLGDHKQQQFLVGFAAETQQLLAYGKDKLERKHLDAIVLNDVSRSEIGFDSEQNEVIFIAKDGTEQAIEQAAKLEIAEQLIELIDDQIRKG